MRFAYYPGCSLHSTAVEFDISTRAVAPLLGIELVEIPNWVCCGASPTHQRDSILSYALAVANFNKAELVNEQIGVQCASCYNNLRRALFELHHSDEIKKKVEKVAGLDFGNNVQVFHLLDVFRNQIGLEAIKEKVTHPLKGLNVAAYYGCLLTRPPAAVAFDDPEWPTSMDDILQTCGATMVDWPYKTECCGASLALSRTDVVQKLSHDILKMAKTHGADCIAVACPLCHSNLDLRQKSIEKKFAENLELPIFYYTQLMGLAFGLSGKELGLDKLIVNPWKLLEEKGIGSKKS